MLDEEPQLFFLHLWKIGDAVQPTREARAALERMNVRLAAER